MAHTLLEKAKRAFYRKRYNDVLTLLEPNIIQYRDSFPFYFYLGLACMHTGDIGGATSYFQRARQIKMRDPDLLCAQAALYLRRGETHQAVEYYLEALEYHPSHRLAKKSLEFIRKKGDSETIEVLVETDAIKRFYPRPRPQIRFQSFLFPLIVISFIFLTIIVFRSVYDSSIHNNSRADLSSLSLNTNDRGNIVELGGSYRFVLTEKQVIKTYHLALSLFQDYRDNAAQVEINRLLNSNASLSVKQKARLLMTYFQEPGFDTIRDRYDWATVQNDPLLYLDCSVVWKGMATNIVENTQSLSFDFLVGYDTRNTLEGIVPVVFTSPVRVDPAKPLEVLGKIQFDGGKISISGKGIYQSGKPAH